MRPPAEEGDATMASFLVYLGLPVLVVGGVVVVRPVQRMPLLRRRFGGAAVAGAGVTMILGGMLWPAQLQRCDGVYSQLDEIMPAYHFCEVHATRVQGTAAVAYSAVRGVTADEIELFRLLMGARSLPARIAGKRRSGLGTANEPLLDEMLRSGFLVLAEEPGREIVFGLVGRVWRMAGDERPPGVDGLPAFVAFERPGYAKVATNLVVTDSGDGWCRVTTETRILATDASARRAFGAYWRVIRPGSGLLRRSWLAAIRRRAEGAASSPGASG